MLQEWQQQVATADHARRRAVVDKRSPDRGLFQHSRMCAGFCLGFGFCFSVCKVLRAVREHGPDKESRLKSGLLFLLLV